MRLCANASTVHNTSIVGGGSESVNGKDGGVEVYQGFISSLKNGCSTGSIYPWLFTLVALKMK